MNFDYKENGGMKALLANPKHQYHVSQCGEHDCSAQHKKNVDYYENPSLTHLMDKLFIIRKMMERNAFLANRKHQSCIQMWRP